MVKVNMTEDDLKERTMGNWFNYGVYPVVIEEAKRDTNKNGKDFISLKVLGENDEEAVVQLWVTTENAAKISLATLSAIGVHNQTTDAEKKKVRDAFLAIDDTDKVTDKFLSAFKGKEAWIDVRAGNPNPNGGYYKEFRIFSFEPTHKYDAREGANAPLTDVLANAEDYPEDDVPFN